MPPFHSLALCALMTMAGFVHAHGPASVPRDGQTWFYKMMGDDATVAREKDAFVKFVQTARYP